MRDSKTVYQELYEYAPLSKARIRDLLSQEQFKMAWIGAQNSHRKCRIAIVATSGGTLYGLTLEGEKQLHKWEK